MAKQGNYRIHRTRLTFLAISIVAVLASVLFLRVGKEPARIVLEAIGTVTLTMVFASLIMDSWLWKTRVGKLLGFPPDYSGKWVGTIQRTVQTDNDSPTETKIEAIVSQRLTQLEWKQYGYRDGGEKYASSHLILGEVVDYHGKWDGIIGVYEVTRSDGRKDEGVQVLTIENDGNEISGWYAGVNGNVGKMILRKEERGS